MEIDELKQHLDNKFDKIDAKLDVHLERLTRAETQIQSTQGTIKIIVSLFMTVVGGVLTVMFTKLGFKL